MTIENVVGASLNQVTAITAIVSTRIYNGMRPATTTVPCINYFEMPGGKRQYGIERTTFTINCRATTAGTALQLARLVDDLFHGTSGTGVYGNVSGFSVLRSSLVQNQGLIPETADNLYNCPVDILLVYPTSSVS